MHIENNHHNNIISHLLDTLKVPSDVLSTLYALSHSISITTLLGGYHYWSPFYRWGSWGLWHFVTGPKSTTSSGLSGVGKAWGEEFSGQGLDWAKWKFCLGSSGGGETLDCQCSQRHPTLPLREKCPGAGAGWTGHWAGNLVRDWVPGVTLTSCVISNKSYIQFPQQKSGEMGLEYPEGFFQLLCVCVCV